MMDEEDFVAVLAELQKQLRDVGAEEIGDPRHYTTQDSDTGEARLLEPDKHLTLMLSAFGRKLAIEDRATYHTAMIKIREALSEGGPNDAQVELLDGRVVNLSEAPDLSKVREELEQLIFALRSAPPAFRTPV